MFVPQTLVHKQDRLQILPMRSSAHPSACSMQQTRKIKKPKFLAHSKQPCTTILALFPSQSIPPFLKPGATGDSSASKTPTRNAASVPNTSQSCKMARPPLAEFQHQECIHPFGLPPLSIPRPAGPPDRNRKFSLHNVQVTVSSHQNGLKTGRPIPRSPRQRPELLLVLAPQRLLRLHDEGPDR